MSTELPPVYAQDYFYDRLMTEGPPHYTLPSGSLPKVRVGAKMEVKTGFMEALEKSRASKQ